jgi:hypothetical protein
MREGKRERELKELKYEMKSIPISLKEIKRRGRHVQSCQNKVRKAAARFERARRICLDLPKPWTSYHAHGKGMNLYANPKVQEIHDADKRLFNERDYLRMAVESYHKRYTDRVELKARLRKLPDLIESAMQLAEIEAKKKALRLAKAKPEKNWRDQWQEVVDGLVVSAKTLKAYLKTFSHPVPFDENTVKVDTVNQMFTYRPSGNTFLKLPCYTWEQAEYR